MTNTAARPRNGLARGQMNCWPYTNGQTTLGPKAAGRTETQSQPRSLLCGKHCVFITSLFFYILVPRLSIRDIDGSVLVSVLGEGVITPELSSLLFQLLIMFPQQCDIC